ncbi:MAG: dihydroorotate dehydrogenase electron transfer subunit [Bacteroidetes bacterium]|nr:dihydroorotate dehydrogenase electron transfer subunit [Bacteroidota bacterium]MBU1718227.1 dihydroorotate dehydrogenase electron transfer subunit [Bacteroidota bacterium]
MKKTMLDMRVIRNKRLNPDHFLLELASPKPVSGIRPGQFAEVLVENSPTTFLRRPFSIHFVNEEEKSVELYIKRAGEGTRTLGYLEEGDFVNVILPLGNGFALPSSGKVLLIGGGCGVAPLLYLAKEAHSNHIDCDILIGGKDKDQISESERYSRYGRLHVMTEDGSCGEIGLVTQHPVVQRINDFSAIYCCGPEPMMKAVANMTRNSGVPVYVSLENTMACGIGACLCCVVNTNKGNVCVCTDGPVFKSDVLSNW